MLAKFKLRTLIYFFEVVIATENAINKNPAIAMMPIVSPNRYQA
jgi:hypothetical protein